MPWRHAAPQPEETRSRTTQVKDQAQGLSVIPGVRPVHAANHWARAIESHAANFPDVDWTGWARWRREIEAVGYRTRLIALNSMHAQSVWTRRAPQSRDRFYLAYIR